MGRKPLRHGAPPSRSPWVWRGVLLRPKWLIASVAGFWLFCFLVLGRTGTEHRPGPRQLAEQLASRLSSEQLSQHTAAQLRNGFQTAIGATNSSGQAGQAQQKEPALTMQLHNVVQQLTYDQSAVRCWLDPTMQLDLHLGQQKVLLAANMHNNEELLPHYITQLTHLLSVLPPGSAFLSIYESDSSDSTGLWLEILNTIMSAMEVPHRIVTGGNLTRQEGQDRIDFLAQARNLALEVLWLNASAAGLEPARESEGQAQGLDVSRSGRHLQWRLPKAELKADQPVWAADKVVFLNDVYFCARDVVRLLHHDADIACGMDFDRLKLQDSPLEVQRRLFGEDLWRRFRIPPFLGRLLGRWEATMWRWRRGAANDRFQDGAKLEFYDTWVARDMDGNLFTKQAPYVTDPYSLERVRDGLTFPVKCCWNGVLALSAKPFVQHGLRIRMHKEGECAASECSHMCNDFMRSGFTNFIVDPSVRQAYNARDARDLYDSNMVQGLPVLDWATLAKAPAIDRTLSPLRPYYQCCGLKPGHNMIDFAEDCGWDNFMAPNYTDPALPFAAPVADNATQLRVQNTTEALGAEVAEAQPNAAVSLRRWRKQQAGEARSQT